MTTLYNITADLIALEEMVVEAYEERGGLSSKEEAEIALTIEQIRSGSKEKLEDYAKVLLNMKASQEAIKFEANRLRKKAVVLENAQDKLKSAVKYYMETANLRKIEAGAFTFTICKNGGKLPLLINCLPEALPEKYQVKTISANNELIRADLIDDKTIDGAKLGERGTNIRVR